MLLNNVKAFNCCLMLDKSNFAKDKYIQTH